VVLEQYPLYKQIQTEIYVRLTNLPIDDKLRELRCACGGEAGPDARWGALCSDGGGLVLGRGGRRRQGQAC
jgi:hypothetical protein